MSEIKNGRLGLYGAEYSKCSQMMTLCFKGLSHGYMWKKIILKFFQCFISPVTTAAGYILNKTLK